MSNAKKQLPRIKVDEMFAICALNERKECLKGIRSPMGRIPDATDLAIALRELDDITLQWAVKKYFAKSKPFQGVNHDAL